MAKRRSGLFAAVAMLFAAAVSIAAVAAVRAGAGGPGDVTTARLAAADKEPGNWLTVGGTFDEQRFSNLDQINPSTIGRLKLAWYGDFDTSRGQEATPLVVDGVLYTTTAWSKVYAYDAATGKQLWRYDPQVAGSKGQDACCDVVNRGVAVWSGKVYVGTIDGRLIALDAKTGSVVWSVMTADTAQPYTITGAPRIVKGKVVIGNGGAEYGVRGFVSAYDAETGKLAWRFYTTPNPENKPDGAVSDKVLMEKAYATWGDGMWRQSGGGAPPWDAIVYDRDFNQIYIGTGSGTPWNHRLRGMGDNLFVSSVVALDADTGAYKWHYQEVPGEEWDLDSTMPIMLATLNIDGAPRKVLMHAPKAGFFYVIDRKDGKLISAEKFTLVNWAKSIDMSTGRPIEFDDMRYSEHGTTVLAQPAALGSHNWNPMAYSPKTGLVYIPAAETPFALGDDKNFVFKPGHGITNLGVSTAGLPSPSTESQRIALQAMYKGELLAWDPVKQKQAWRVAYRSVGAGGILATAGNLVFQGTPDGTFHAYRADNGEELWKFDGQYGIVAGAMSYMAGGSQYIAVLAGLGGTNGLLVPYMDHAHAGMGRILVFKLDGAAKLPPASYVLRPAAVPNETWPTDVVNKGAGFYYGNCFTCHGLEAISNGIVPDLRRSPMVLTKEGWQSVVIGGALESQGMPNFSARLKPEDAEAIRAWIADHARQLQKDEAAK